MPSPPDGRRTPKRPTLSTLVQRFKRGRGDPHQAGHQEPQPDPWARWRDPDAVRQALRAGLAQARPDSYLAQLAGEATPPRQPDPGPEARAARELADRIGREHAERAAQTQTQAVLDNWGRFWLARVRDRLGLGEDDPLPEGIERAIIDYAHGEDVARLVRDLQPLDQRDAADAIAAWGEQHVVDRFADQARERRDAELERARHNRERARRSGAHRRERGRAPQAAAPMSSAPITSGAPSPVEEARPIPRHREDTISESVPHNAPSNRGGRPKHRATGYPKDQKRRIAEEMRQKVRAGMSYSKACEPYPFGWRTAKKWIEELDAGLLD